MTTLTPPKFGEYGKLQFDFILMQHIDRINQQIMKLPHEMLDEKFSKPLGCTYADIITSYADGVEHLEGLLKPYLTDEYKKEAEKLTRPTTKERELFVYAKTKFGALMDLCDKKSLLLQKIATHVNAEDEDDAQV